MKYRPLPTHEVALLCGVNRQTLFDWSRQEKLKLAPKPRADRHMGGGPGRSAELLWSAAAVKEAVEYAAARKSHRERRSDRTTAPSPQLRGEMAA